MVDTFTQRTRLALQETGSNLNTWGNRANSAVFSLADEAIAGVASFTLSGPKTLTSNNGASDEARRAVINVTGGTGGTITIPSVQKIYLVSNRSTGNVILTTGAGATATIPAGDGLSVFCDGTNVYVAKSYNFAGQKITNVGTATVSTDGINKAYGDNILTLANTYTDQVAQQSGNLPNQSGFAGRLLTTDGTSASWATPVSFGFLISSNNLSDLSSVATARTNLGLGNSATRAVGTAIGTVAAGDDSRIAGALQKNLNLSDIQSASSGRSNLGLGTAATFNTVPIANGGTGSTTASAARTALGLGTAATQASSAFLQASNNLSDITSIASALTALGGFTGNNSATGYMRVPVNIGGVVVQFILQWREISAVNGTNSISWPTAFPNICLSAFGNFTSSGFSADRSVAVYSKSTSGATVNNGGVTANVTVWAVGY